MQATQAGLQVLLGQAFGILMRQGLPGGGKGRERSFKTRLDADFAQFDAKIAGQRPSIGQTAG